jgi:glyoxylase I family protein
MVRILGLVFAGTSTGARDPMSAFLRSAFGLRAVPVDGVVGADVFDLPDGASFVVAEAGGMGAERTVGFLVEDVDAAAGELRALGVEVDAEIAANERWRYVHFRAPDGHVYELIEARHAPDAAAAPEAPAAAQQ